MLCEEGKTSGILNCYQTCHAFHNQWLPYKPLYTQTCHVGYTESTLHPFLIHAEHYIQGKFETNLETTRRNQDKLHNCKTGVNLTSLG